MAVNPQDAGVDPGFPEDPRHGENPMQPPVGSKPPPTDLANWGWGQKAGQAPDAVDKLPTDPLDKAFDPKPLDPMDKSFDPQPAEGEPVSKIESQNRETSWYKDVVSKFKDVGSDIYSRFIGQEGEGTLSLICDIRGGPHGL